MQGTDPLILTLARGHYCPKEHQHSIAIAARRDKHHVDAIVRLFGELTYFVVLSDHCDGADFCTSLVYDAYRGEENGMLFAHEQAEILQMKEGRKQFENSLGRFGRVRQEFLRLLGADDGTETPQGHCCEQAGGESREADPHQLMSIRKPALI